MFSKDCLLTSTLLQSHFVFMSSFLSVLGRSVLRPMAGAVISSITVVMPSCASISSHWEPHIPRIPHYLRNEEIESITRETGVDRLEDIQHMVRFSIHDDHV